MDLWSRIRQEIASHNTKQEAVADHLGVHPVTFRKWMSQKITMDAMQIVSIARLFDTTAEELVDGKEGRDYILDWAGRHGAKWKPPNKLRELMPLLEAANEQTIEMAVTMVRKSNEIWNKEQLAAESNPEAYG